MNWIQITSIAQLDEIKAKSTTKPQVVFKHSFRCSISGMTKSRLERSQQPDNIDFYFLDLINYREELEAWLEHQDYSHSNLLLMSSGNFDGLDVTTFAGKIASNLGD